MSHSGDYDSTGDLTKYDAETLSVKRRLERSIVTEIEVNYLEIKVDASELKKEKGELIKSLADFLQEKTSADVLTEGDKVTVKGEGDAVTKKYVKVLLKKFLHKQILTETFRVIMDKDDVLKVKERRLYEEEE